MRIAYLTQSYPPMVSGASLAVQMLAEGMAMRGHDVLVLTSSDVGRAYSQRSGRLTVHHNHSSINPFRVGQRYTRWSYRENMKLLGDFQPDVVHTHDPLQLALTGLIYCRKKAVPIAITTHQLPWFVMAYLPDGSTAGKIIERGLWRYSNWLLRRFDAVISPTTTIANMINEKTGVASHVINYGIEPDWFYAEKNKDAENVFWRRKFNIPPDVPILLHVGRLDMDKNVEIVVRAVARTIIKNRAHLLVIGDGTEKSRLVKLCEDLGIGDCSHFPGYVTSRSHLADIYRIADVFITASEIETQGIVLIEAAACGLPIVAVDATCVAEIVRNGENGYLTNPKDINGLSKRVNWVIENPKLAESMGQAGIAISQKYNQLGTLGHHDELYGNMIAMAKKLPIMQKKPLVKLRFPQW